MAFIAMFAAVLASLSFVQQPRTVPLTKYVSLDVTACVAGKAPSGANSGNLCLLNCPRIQQRSAGGAKDLLEQEPIREILHQRARVGGRRVLYDSDFSPVLAKITIDIETFCAANL